MSAYRENLPLITLSRFHLYSYIGLPNASEDNSTIINSDTLAVQIVLFYLLNLHRL
jgi:hypothetical protein